MQVSIGIAFIAGLLSFFSPCVFSLVPAYVSYLSGRTAALEQSNTYKSNRWRTLLHGLAFVFGFGVVLLSLGLATSILGSLRFEYADWLAKIGGVLVIIFGLHTLGVFHIPFLAADTRKQYDPLQDGLSYGSSFLMGLFFTAGWSPCVGPILGGILTFAANPSTEGRGILLLLAYWLGLAIPFLGAAAATEQISLWVRKFSKWTRYVQIATGILLVVLGVLLLTGQLARINILIAQNQWLIDLQLWLDQWLLSWNQR
jgi:cytochrome c-type biogenesis protein